MLGSKKLNQINVFMNDERFDMILSSALFTNVCDSYGYKTLYRSLQN